MYVVHTAIIFITTKIRVRFRITDVLTQNGRLVTTAKNIYVVIEKIRVRETFDDLVEYVINYLIKKRIVVRSTVV